jgi:hypothetical protein
MEVKDFIFASLEKNILAAKNIKDASVPLTSASCQVGRNLFLVIGYPPFFFVFQ